MTKDEFLSGQTFKHKAYNTYTYQYEPPQYAPGAGGYLWQITYGNNRHCLATFNEIGDQNASIHLVVLGKYMVVEFNYDDFEIV
jgi:hypothetical protein